MTARTITRRALFATLASLPFVKRNASAVPATTGEVKAIRGNVAEAVTYAPVVEASETAVTSSNCWYSNQWDGTYDVTVEVRESDGSWKRLPDIKVVHLGTTADWPEGV